MGRPWTLGRGQVLQQRVFKRRQAAGKLRAWGESELSVAENAAADELTHKRIALNERGIKLGK